MHLSISNSKPAPVFYAKVLVGICVILIVALEISSEYLLKRQRPVPPAAEFQNIANSRLELQRELCEAHGAKLIVLVPPTPSSENTVRQMTIAAQRARVDTLVPIDQAALSARFYKLDELHLNSEDAQLFTSALATFLPLGVDPEPVASRDQVQALM